MLPVMKIAAMMTNDSIGMNLAYKFARSRSSNLDITPTNYTHGVFELLLSKGLYGPTKKHKILRLTQGGSIRNINMDFETFHFLEDGDFILKRSQTPRACLGLFTGT